MEAVSLCNVYLFLRTHSALGLLCFNQDETLLGWKCTVFQLGWNGVKNVIGVKVYSVSIGMKRCTEWTLNRDWDEAVLGWTCVGMNLHWDDMSRDMVCRAEKMETKPTKGSKSTSLCSYPIFSFTRALFRQIKSALCNNGYQVGKKPLVYLLPLVLFINFFLSSV